MKTNHNTLNEDEQLPTSQVAPADGGSHETGTRRTESQPGRLGWVTPGIVITARRMIEWLGGPGTPPAEGDEAARADARAVIDAATWPGRRWGENGKREADGAGWSAVFAECRAMALPATGRARSLAGMEPDGTRSMKAIREWLQRQMRLVRERWAIRNDVKKEGEFRATATKEIRTKAGTRRHRVDEDEYGRLVVELGGFYWAMDGQREATVAWSDVRTIRTFKRDLFSHDVICLAFEIGDDEWIEAWESMVDFELVHQAMMKRFPDLPEDWYSTVMLPAFEANERVLWRRQARELSE
jgi:hypothetical protein